MSLEQELKDLCAEANNLDYYLSGYVEADKLEDIIRRHLDPDYKFENPHWGRRPTVDKEPSSIDLTIQKVYGPTILHQLQQESFIADRIFNHDPP